MTGPSMQRLLAEVALLRMAVEIANAAVVSDIETECTRHTEGGFTWFDLTPMTDPREHSPQVCDMAAQAIAYAVEAGLVRRHPNPALPHLVRIAKSGHASLPPASAQPDQAALDLGCTAPQGAGDSKADVRSTTQTPEDQQDEAACGGQDQTDEASAGAGQVA